MRKRAFALGFHREIAMKYRWSMAPAQPLIERQLVSSLGLDELLARCLVNRGVSEPGAASKFLEPRLNALADPFLLPGMTRAVSRLFDARARSEPLVIFGDYDVDGVTSSALLLEVLTALGWKVDCYLPHRIDEGYGLSQEAAANCLARFPVPLLLAVDCGSTAVATVEWLRTRSVDVIVLDHHQISDPPPSALALVNPRVGICPAGTAADIGPGPDRVVPFQELCSVGLAFKLAHAVVKHGRQIGLPEAADYDLRPLLDLVALGTIADLVPLRSENRILVAGGLERLNTTRRPGLLALKSVAESKGTIGVHEVGFQLAPRLNAAGRLEAASAALDLVRAADPVLAGKLARELDSQNRERQRIERGIADDVISTLRTRFDAAQDFVIVEGQMLWHVGVVGIVASRVLREFHRPTIILGGDGVEWRGSGRSIEGFDLAAALRHCDDLLLRHGGHAMAAGLSIRPDQVPALRERLNGLARQSLSRELLQPLLRLDAELTASDLTVEQLDELARLEPVGQGNPPVQLVIPGVTCQRPVQRMGRDQQHAKLWITDGGPVREVVWWNCPDAVMPHGRFDLAAAPQINEYAGRRSVQLKLLDWRQAG